MSKKMKIIVAIALVVVSLGGAGIYMGGKFLMNMADEIVVNPPADQLIKVDAETYSNAYKTDSKVAYKKYELFIVEIAGVVSEVKDKTVVLEGALPIRVDMQKDVNLATIKKGDSIVVRGMPIEAEKDGKELPLITSIIVNK